MKPVARVDSGRNDLFRSRLDQIVDMNHALAKLARQVDWGFLEKVFGAVYKDGPGHPPLPTRLMAGLAILPRKFCDCAVELSNRFVEVTQLRHERRERLGHNSRHRPVTRLDAISQLAGVSWPLRRDHADLSEMAAQSVDQLRTLRDQHFPRFVTHQRRLVFERAHTDKSH